MAGRKGLPIGIDLFEMIRKEDFYYVDKTLFIKELIDTRGMVNLFTRPRRFGKTLIMSMVKSFFEAGSSPELFAGLAIEGERELCSRYQGKFPVVFLSLKSVEGEDYEGALRNLAEIISDEAQRHRSLLDSERVAKRDKARLGEMINSRASTICGAFCT